MNDQNSLIGEGHETHGRERPTYTAAPLAWQKFGDKWCLTGQYGMRPIVLSTDPKGNLKLLDSSTGLLVPFDPKHPDARLIAAAPAMFDALIVIAKLGELDGSPFALSAAKTARAAIAKAEGVQS